MGNNCTNYCVSENEGKQKVTVEQGFYNQNTNPDYKSVNDDQNKPTEFEIDYSSSRKQVQSYAKAGPADNQNQSQKENFEPLIQPNGSTYTGQTSNGKKHGKGEQIWPDGSKYVG